MGRKKKEELDEFALQYMDDKKNLVMEINTKYEIPINALELKTVEELLEIQRIMADKTEVVGETQEVAQDKTDKVRPPSYISPEWHDYIMGLFTNEEKDDKGNPRVDGLRRVAELALGEIVSSRPVQSSVNGETAFVTWELQIFWRPGIEVTVDLNTDYIPVRTFGACASAYFEHTKSPYNKHLGSIADTKAEAKCLRRALRLRNCSAEELDEVPYDERVTDGSFKETEPMSEIQKVQINVMCHKLGIDAAKLWKSTGWKEGDDYLKGVASNLLAQLNSYQGGNKQEIPEDVKI